MKNVKKKKKKEVFFVVVAAVALWALQSRPHASIRAIFSTLALPPFDIGKALHFVPLHRSERRERLVVKMEEHLLFFLLSESPSPFPFLFLSEQKEFLSDLLGIMKLVCLRKLFLVDLLY